jgi:hypothetical protein
MPHRVAPDITLENIVLSGVSNSKSLDNRPPSNAHHGTPCTLFTLDWSADSSVVSLTIVIQGAPDNAGVPGTFATIASSSVFPSGKLNYYSATKYYPWMRVAVTATGGAGKIAATLMGWHDDAAAIVLSQSGGGGTSSGFGAAFPATGTAAGVENPSGDMVGLQVDASGNLLTDIKTSVGVDPDETGFVVGTTPGTPIMGVITPSDSPASGDLAVVALDGSRRMQVAGSFTATPPTSNTVSSAGPQTIGTSSTQALAANSSRKRLILQNVGTTKIWILFGAGAASSSNYHIALPAGGTSNDGSSPIYSDTLWTGAIQAISSAAGGSLQAEEFT